jgi:hypothetical protein
VTAAVAGWLVLPLLVLGVGIAHGRYRRDMVLAEAVWRQIAEARRAPGVYDPAMVADLPEVARRYFGHAIAPGTPLALRAVVAMEGEFLLGTGPAARSLRMTAREVIAPPHGFVWMPRIGRFPMVLRGADGYFRGAAWVRFWLAGVFPLVRRAGGPDLGRSAAARAVMEAIWVPASLLPVSGGRWRAAGPHAAEVTLETANGPIRVELRLSPEGRVLSVRTRRWTDANPGKVFAEQPFGGTMTEEAVFGGYTVPGRVEIGNMFETPDWAPFFRARVTAIDWG